ncbi:MAG: histidine phosphatase family protein [Bryobacter sp.]|nr:histidine phosphatase family protein [Bryobacter sp.]
MELSLLRHGQAGTRDNYDRLSDLGREQAQRAGAHCAARRLEFDLILCGSLRRQRETAEILARQLPSAATPVVDARWAEFDLSAVYQEIAPRLAAADPAFRAEYEAIEREAADPSHAVHRAWRRADMAVVRAWVEGRFPIASESWPQFEARIASALSGLQDYRAERILVVTSATPIGIATASIFGPALPHALPLAGSVYNTALTKLRFRESMAGTQWHLSEFNATAHLDEPRLLTLR